jgi:hypothetical protein
LEDVVGLLQEELTVRQVGLPGPVARERIVLPLSETAADAVEIDGAEERQRVFGRRQLDRQRTGD